MAARPDLAGFIGAQGRLRADFGVDVVLRTPTAVEWDPGEPIDPDTGKPYDPFATPISTGSGFTERTVRALVIDNLGTEDETAVGPSGRVSTDATILSLDVADRAAVLDATEAIVREARYRITEVRPQRSRLLAFLERI